MRMLQIIGVMLIYTIVLGAIFGGLESITGDGQKGGAIIANCMTAFIVYFAVILLFGIGVEGSIFHSGLPLIADIDKYGSINELIHKYSGKFALDFVELVTLMVIIQWLSNLVSFYSEGIVAKVTSQLIIILISCMVYGFLMDVARDNVVIKWLVYCVETIITGGSIIYTPVMLIAYITGFKEGNLAIAYFMKVFSGTALGKSISKALVSSFMLIMLILTLETQYGSIGMLFESLFSITESIGAVIIIIFGIYIMIKSLRRNKAN